MYVNHMTWWWAIFASPWLPDRSVLAIQRIWSRMKRLGRPPGPFEDDDEGEDA